RVIPLSRTIVSHPTHLTRSVHSNGVPLVPLVPPSATSSAVEGSDSQLPFSWTPNAAETLLRLRFDSMPLSRLKKPKAARRCLKYVGS
ncbi:hypothetical protein JG688_00007077, partial [Phytophthora aleatoria]